ncbi:MAG: hypothetical protein JO053_02100, partial [Acidobacteria bacterium]|nr:hypothetical protein [Acidobacteriota bacterium]
MLVGKTLDEATRLPSLEDVVNKQSLELLSNYPARLVGYSSEEEIYIAEEERDGNFHIIGAPKQGKSKFLIYNMIEDIKLGNGLTLLDPTSNGSTAREVLKYCASVGYEKVCLIDHTTLYTG